MNPLTERFSKSSDSVQPKVEVDSSFIDPSAIIRALRRRARLFGIVAAAVAVAVLLAYFLIDPIYRATAQVEISTNQEKVVDTEQVINGKLPDTYVVDTQVQVLKSRSMARAVVEALRLENDVEFVGEKALSPEQALGQEERRQIAVGTLAKHLKVERSGLAYVISITYESPKATTASRVANAYAEQFVKQDLSTRVNATASATQFLQRRVTELKAELEAKERTAQAFRSANGLLSSDPENQPQMSALSSLETELAQARGEAALQSGRSAGAGSATSDLLAQLRKQQAEVEGRVAELRQRYGDRHPDIQQALSQKADIARQIAAERSRINSNLSSEATSNSARVRALASSVAAARSQIGTQNNSRVKLAELEREVEATRTLYQTYLTRLRETTAQRGLETSSSEVLSLSTVPNLPASPSLPLFAALALLGGLGAGSFAVAIVEARDNTMHTVADVEQALGIRSLASVPNLYSSLTPSEKKVYAGYDSDFVLKRPKSGFSESFRMLRTALTAPEGATPYQVVAITSSLPREGKTSLAAAFAQVAALDGVSTILVECDTRKIGGATHHTATAGTIQVIKGEAQLNSALLRDPSGCAILPILPSDEGTDITSVGDFGKLVELLRPHFALIVLDMAPVLPIAEARLLCTYADATALLVHWNTTSQAAAQAALGALKGAGANVVGSVLTQVDLSKQHLYSAADINSYYGMYTSYYT